VSKLDAVSKKNARVGRLSKKNARHGRPSGVQVKRHSYPTRRSSRLSPARRHPSTAWPNHGRQRSCNRAGNGDLGQLYNPVRFGCGSILFRAAGRAGNQRRFFVALRTEADRAARNAFPSRVRGSPAGHEINFWSPTGCGSALTSLARGRLTRPLCSTA
jgi:hypothetical protein